jgi:serine/threonine-protein kinase
MPEFPIRVEAAAYRGRPVYFEIVPPWRGAARQVAVAGFNQAVLAPLMAVFLTALGVGTLLAVRNLRLGRGDRRGAVRLGIFMFATRLVYWVFDTHHITSMGELSNLLITGLESALFWPVFLAVMYLALEPLLRRHFPERLIGWSRLLAGEFRDPLVGRDLLAGSVAGAAVLVVNYLGYLALGWLGLARGIPDTGGDLFHLGFEGFVGNTMNSIAGAGAFTFIGTFVLLVLMLLLRHQWAGIATGWLVFSCLIAADNLYKGPHFVPVSILMAAVPMFVLARFGMLAMLATLLVIHLKVFSPVTTELSSWYARGFVLYLFLMVALATWGAHTARAGRPLFRARVLD